MDSKKDTRTEEELKEDLEKKIAYYEGQLKSTLDQVTRGIITGKIEKTRQELKGLTAKKMTPVIKTRIEDPTVGEKRRKKKFNSENIGSGSIVNTGNGIFTINF